MNKQCLILCSVLVLAGCATAPAPAEPAGDASGAASLSSSSAAPQIFTMEFLQEHASQESCYTAINGEVFDVTSFTGRHPGGEAAILGLCGKDGTAAFTAMHGSDPSKAALLARMKIGTVQ